MRKLLIFVVIVAAVVFGVAPYMIGTKAEASYKESMQALEQQIRLNLPAEAIEFTSEHRYERSWLNAEGQTTWMFDAPSGDGLFKLVFVHDVSHVINPLTQSLATIDTTVQLPEDAPQQLLTALKGESPLRVTQHVLWSGGQKIDIHSPAASFSDDEGSMAWGGIQGDVTVSSAIDEYAGEIEIPSLKGGSKDEPQVDVSGISMTFAGNLLQKDVWLGDGVMKMQKMQIENPDGSRSHLKDMTFSANVDQNGDEFLDVGYALNLASLEADGMKIGEIDFQLVLAKLDLAAYAAAAGKMNEIGSAQMSDAERMQAMIETGMEFAKAALAKKPEIRLENLSVDTGEGVAKSNGKVEYVGNLVPQTLEELPLMIAGVLANVHIEAPKDAIRWFAEKQLSAQLAGIDGMDEATMQQMVDQQVEQFTAMGFMKEQGSKLVSDIKFEQGALTVNGQPMAM